MSNLMSRLFDALAFANAGNLNALQRQLAALDTASAEPVALEPAPQQTIAPVVFCVVPNRIATR